MPHEIAVGGGTVEAVGVSEEAADAGVTDDERRTEMGALVVGYDGSECASAALDDGARARRATGDRIVIGFGYEPGGYGEEHAAHREEVRKFGERVTRRRSSAPREAGVEVELGLVPERPIDALSRSAEKHDARAIVVGTYGERPIKGALLGSMPHKLLHLSERPVLVVPVATEPAAASSRRAMSDACDSSPSCRIEIESYELDRPRPRVSATSPGRSTIVHLQRRRRGGDRRGRRLRRPRPHRPPRRRARSST